MKHRPSRGGAPSAGTLLAAAAVLAATILACGRPEATDTLTPLDQSAASPRTDVVIAVPRGPTTLEPGLEHELYSIAILDNVYESLVRRDGASGLAPALAERWENPDDLTWRFRIRPGVRFHDGSLLDAETVAQGLRSEWLAGETPDAVSGDAGLPIETIEVDGRWELVVRTTEPVGLLAPLGRHRVWTRSEDGLPVGTGPFFVGDFVPGDSIELHRFDGHWALNPRIDRMVFWMVPEAERRLERLVAGEVDLVFDPPDEIDFPTSGDDVEIVNRPGLRVILLGIRDGDRSGSLLANREVREAIDLAIDRERLVEVGLNGLGTPVSQLVTEEVFGHDAEATPRPYAPDTARRLIALAGPRPTVRLAFPTDLYRNLDLVAELIAEDLRAVGLEVSLDRAPHQELMPRLRDGEPGLFLLGWMSAWDAGVSYRFLVRSAGASGEGSNFFGYSNPVVDAALAEDRLELDPLRRTELLAHVTRILGEERPFLPLYRQDDRFALRRGLVFEPRLGARIPGATLDWSSP